MQVFDFKLGLVAYRYGFVYVLGKPRKRRPHCLMHLCVINHILYISLWLVLLSYMELDSDDSGLWLI